LLKLYHKTLVECGVQDYSFGQLRNHYLGLLLNLALAMMLVRAMVDRIDRNELSIGDRELSILGPLEFVFSDLLGSDRGSAFLDVWIFRAEASLAFWVPGGRFAGKLLLKLLRRALQIRNWYLRRHR